MYPHKSTDSNHNNISWFKNLFMTKTETVTIHPVGNIAQRKFLTILFMHVFSLYHPTKGSFWLLWLFKWNTHHEKLKWLSV